MALKFPSEHDDRFLSMEELCAWLDASEDDIRRWTKYGGFPEYYYLGYAEKPQGWDQCRWRRREVEHWIGVKPTVKEMEQIGHLWSNRNHLMDDGRILLPKQVTDYLSLAPDTLRFWRTKGYGPPSVKIEPDSNMHGDRQRYIKREVDEWVASRPRKKYNGRKK